MWDSAEPGAQPVDFGCQGSRVRALAVLPDGRVVSGGMGIIRIWDPEVRIDGDLAQVWAYYTFHRNGAFSHCGVDAFMLLKVGGEWKITQLADSRRTTGCTHT